MACIGSFLNCGDHEKDKVRPEKQMKIKIVFITEAMLGGIRQHVLDIMNHLNPEEYEIFLIYSDLRADEKFLEEKGELEKKFHLIKCNKMRRALGIHDLSALREIYKIIHKIQPNIVHCHSSKAGFLGRLAAKKCKVKKVYYTPNAYIFQNPGIGVIKKTIYIFAERFLSRFATTLTINVSKGEMQFVYNYKLDIPEKFILIYNGISSSELPDKKELRTTLGFDDKIYYVGVTARCTEQKDPFTFLEIAKTVIEQKDMVEFVYIGDGELQDAMKRWISKNKLQDRIHMLGFRSDASQIVGAFDLYLSTALYEGLPYSVLEAMRAGVPIVATDIVGNNELVFEGRNGMLFPVGDINYGVKLIMEQIMKEKITCSQVRNIFTSNFSVTIMTKKLEKIYKERNN